MKIIASIYGTDIGVLEDIAGTIHFQYYPSFKDSSFELSPFVYPYQKGVFSNYYKDNTFEGLPSIFADSLPDSFGNKFMNEYFYRESGSQLSSYSPLKKLMYVGKTGFGAIEYSPSHEAPLSVDVLGLSEYRKKFKKVLEGNCFDVLSDEELKNNSSAGGARPKLAIKYKPSTQTAITNHHEYLEGFSDFIVKFQEDGAKSNLTRLEATYMKIAQKAKILCPYTELLVEDDTYYFLSERFDRNSNREEVDEVSFVYKKHLQTLSALTKISHIEVERSFTYEHYLSLIFKLTTDIEEVKQGYKLMVFNAIGMNHDDHLKNFSFIMDTHGKWSVSPAYDLIYSSGDGVYGEHKMSINAKYKNISVEDLISVALKCSLSLVYAKEVIKDTLQAFNSFRSIAKKHFMDDDYIDEVYNAISSRFHAFNVEGEFKEVSKKKIVAKKETKKSNDYFKRIAKEYKTKSRI